MPARANRQARERPLLEALKAVVAEARNEPAAAQRVLAFQAKAHLDALAEPSLSEETASFLLDALDRGGFDTLKGDAGIDCRVRAVELLLQRGFPDALKLRPEDLDHYRHRRGRGRSISTRLMAQLTPWLGIVGGAVEATGGVFQLLLGAHGLLTRGPGSGWQVLFGLIALHGLIVVSLLLFSSRERRPARLRNLLASTLIGLVMLALPG